MTTYTLRCSIFWNGEFYCRTFVTFDSISRVVEHINYLREDLVLDGGTFTYKPTSLSIEPFGVKITPKGNVFTDEQLDYILHTF